jgi:spore germination protein
MNPFRKWFSKYNVCQKQGENSPDIPLSNDLNYNLSAVESLFNLTPDLVIRKFQIRQTNEKAALIYLDSLVDKNSINNHVLYPLINESGANSDELPITIGPIKQEQMWKKIEAAILQGKSVLIIEGMAKAYLLDTQGFPQRAIEDPQSEASLRGAHQGFIETGSQNISLIRRYINSRELKVKEIHVGRRAETKLSILYLEDVANPELLNELEKRI